MPEAMNTIENRIPGNSEFRKIRKENIKPSGMLLLALLRFAATEAWTAKATQDLLAQGEGFNIAPNPEQQTALGYGQGTEHRGAKKVCLHHH